MNRDIVLAHLKEAQEELSRTIAEFETDPRYDIGEFAVAMGHVYHHVNVAWNGRDASDEQHRECSRRSFDTWRGFPSESDLPLGLAQL